MDSPAMVVLNIYNHQRIGTEAQYKKVPVSQLLISTECYFFKKCLPLIAVHFAKKVGYSPRGCKSQTWLNNWARTHARTGVEPVFLGSIRELAALVFSEHSLAHSPFPLLDNSCSSFDHPKFHFPFSSLPLRPCLSETSFLTLPHNLLCLRPNQSGSLQETDIHSRVKRTHKEWWSIGSHSHQSLKSEGMGYPCESWGCRGEVTNRN